MGYGLATFTHPPLVTDYYGPRMNVTLLAGSVFGGNPLLAAAKECPAQVAVTVPVQPEGTKHENDLLLGPVPNSGGQAPFAVIVMLLQKFPFGACEFLVTVPLMA